MAKNKRILFLILILIATFNSAVPQRNRQRLVAKKIQQLKHRTVLQKRVAARLETITPYPTSDELKPEVPFEEGNIPDKVYGPPEIDQIPADQLPSEEAPEDFAPNLDAEEFQSAEEKIVSPLKAYISRLTKGKKLSEKSLSSLLLDKSRQRLIVSPFQGTFTLGSFRAPSQQYLFSNQHYSYPANYQSG